MKRIHLVKRDRRVTLKTFNLQKPFGFCCDMYHQDPETQYDMRNPPFESSFPKTKFSDSRPEIKFRVQDIAKVSTPTSHRTAIFREDVEIKQAATYGKSTKGRGPLKWFLEEEIEAAQNLLAKERKLEYKEKEKKLKQKAKIKRNSKRKNKKPNADNNNSSNIEENQSNNLEESENEETNNEINNFVDVF